MPRHLIIIGTLLLSLIFCCSGCPNDRSNDRVNGKIRVVYWDKWTGFEAEAMQKLVDIFNHSQNRIYVDYMIVSEPDKKSLVATAGGDPPDIVGLWQHSIPNFADKNALLPLDEYAAKAGIVKENYIPAYWNICLHRNHLYALPSTPTSLALYWNTDMFKEAGMDPNRPPKSIKELDEFSKKLTKKDKSGKIIQLGFLPNEPDWWRWFWGYWFGGQLWNGKDTITCNSPENLRAYEWVLSYSKAYGTDYVQSFRSGFGNWASPQNAWLSGKVAMEIQGVWMYNYIQNYAPKLHWACAPFPSADPNPNNLAFIEADILCIPNGAWHPDEAFEFIKFVQQQKNMELLCMGQKKFSPLAKVSDSFAKNHPNPFIQVFIDLVHSPRTFSTLDMDLWYEFNDDMTDAFDNIWLQKETPKHALDRVQQRMQKKWNDEMDRFRLLGWDIPQVPPGR